MKENQKDQQVAGNQGGQQNKSGQSNQNTRQESNPSQKSSVTDEEDEETTDVLKEHEDQEHQHDYKTPVGEQNRRDENQKGQQSENSTRDTGKNQS